MLHKYAVPCLGPCWLSRLLSVPSSLTKTRNSFPCSFFIPTSLSFLFFNLLIIAIDSEFPSPLSRRIVEKSQVTSPRGKPADFELTSISTNDEVFGATVLPERTWNKNTIAPDKQETNRANECTNCPWSSNCSISVVSSISSCFEIGWKSKTSSICIILGRVYSESCNSTKLKRYK